MTPAEIRALEEKVAVLKGAYRALEDARRQMAEVNKFVKAGQVWKPELCLHKDGYGYRNVTISVPIPAALIQQHAINEVRKAERAVILLGGEIAEGAANG